MLTLLEFVSRAVLAFAGMAALLAGAVTDDGLLAVAGLAAVCAAGLDVGTDGPPLNRDGHPK